MVYQILSEEITKWHAVAGEEAALRSIPMMAKCCTGIAADSKSNQKTEIAVNTCQYMSIWFIMVQYGSYITLLRFTLHNE